MRASSTDTIQIVAAFLFGFWALVRVSVMALLAGLSDAQAYLASLIDGITDETVSADGLLLGALAALPWL